METFDVITALFLHLKISNTHYLFLFDVEYSDKYQKKKLVIFFVVENYVEGYLHYWRGRKKERILKSLIHYFFFSLCTKVVEDKQYLRIELNQKKRKSMAYRELYSNAR